MKTGVDIHVERGICACIRAALGLPFNQKVQKLIFVIANNLPEEIAYIANEIFGTFGQILDRGNDVEQMLLDFAFDRTKDKDPVLREALKLWENNKTGIGKYIAN